MMLLNTSMSRYIFWILGVLFGTYGCTLYPNSFTFWPAVIFIFLALFADVAPRKLFFLIPAWGLFLFVTLLLEDFLWIFPASSALIALICFPKSLSFFLLAFIILLERTLYIHLSGAYYIVCSALADLLNLFPIGQLNLSATFWGIKYIIILIVIGALLRPRKGWIAIPFLILLQIVTVGVLHTFLFSSYPHNVQDSFLPALMIEIFPQIVFLVGLVYIKRFSADFSPATCIKNAEIKGFCVQASVWCIFVLLLFLSIGDRKVYKKVNNVTIYSNGMLDFKMPDYSNYGISMTGMFGIFCQALRDSGVNVSISETFPDSPENVDLFIIINPTKLPNDGSRSLIPYLKSGGNVLVLGDHTDIAGSMSSLNAILDELGISFNFDSAMPLSGKWNASYDKISYFASLSGDISNLRSRISTGASLKMTDPRCDIIISGKYFFGDFGNRANVENAFLGDYKYQQGERLGDLPLVIQKRCGKGKLVVFGDTSTFQNVVLSQAWPFVSELIARFSSYGAFPGFLPKLLIIVIVLICYCFAIQFPKTVLGVICVMNTFLSYNQYMGCRRSELIPNIPKVYIDASSLNRFDADLWKGNSIGGLYMNVHRAGFWPVTMTSKDMLRKSDDLRAIVFIDPLKPFTSKERDLLFKLSQSSFKHSLIFSVGPNSQKINSHIFDELGFSIENTSLGPIPIQTKIAGKDFIAHAASVPQFANAFPLRLDPKYDWKYIWKYGDNVIVAKRKFGNSELIVISDPEFFWDKTLESEKEAWPANIKLFKHILKDLK